jgi:hypothetical protein
LSLIYKSRSSIHAIRFLKRGQEKKGESAKSQEKGRGLAAVRRYYADGGGDCYAKLQWWG